jgi:uncharacterized membrane protein
MMRWLLSGIVVSALVLTACGKSLPDVDCTGTVPAFEDVSALQKCAMCHSSKLSGTARKNAPGDINFDGKAAAQAKAEDAASEVYGGSMPPSGSGITLTSAEKQALYKWALCR